MSFTGKCDNDVESDTEYTVCLLMLEPTDWGLLIVTEISSDCTSGNGPGCKEAGENGKSFRVRLTAFYGECK